MNTPQTETPTQAWSRRIAQAGEVDFTMMYVAHDAFNRDLARLSARARAGERVHRRRRLATWQLFSLASCTPITPRRTPPCGHACTRSRPTRTMIQVLLDEMEAEHGSSSTAARADRRGTEATGDVDSARRPSSKALAARDWPPTCITRKHAALPLVERRIGAAGWERSAGDPRQDTGGIKGAALYPPLGLDGATDDTKTRVLKLLPPPARLLYRGWERRYDNAGREPQTARTTGRTTAG